MATWKRPLPSEPEFSLEWSPTTDPADTPVWESLTSRLREVHTRSYRQTELDEFETGSLTAVLDNRDRALEPFATAGHRPRKRVRLQARHDGVTHDRFGGFARSLKAVWREPDATLHLACADYGLILNRAQVTISGYPRELVHTRIGRVLDAISIPAGDRSLDTSDVYCEAIPTPAANEEPQTVGALQHCQDAAKSDGGYLFYSLSGDIVFHNRRHRIDTYGAAAATFGPDVAQIPYQRDFEGEVNDATLWNRFTVITANGDREEVTDSVAAADYWDSRKDDFQSLLAKPGEAAALASIVPWRYRDPGYRFPALKPMSGNQRLTDAMMTILLAADVGTRFAIDIEPPGGGSPIAKEVHLEGITEDIVIGQPYGLQFDVSPADPSITEWLLGTSTLGTNTTFGL
jgi:hypothetical protein